jgi:sigma-B regulation protein RsbQ
VFGLDCRSRLAQVTVPTLVLQCLHDSIAPRVVGQYLHRHLAGSRLLELDASGHCPHLSHPQQTIAALAGFVDATHA